MPGVKTEDMGRIGFQDMRPARRGTPDTCLCGKQKRGAAVWQRPAIAPVRLIDPFHYMLRNASAKHAQAWQIGISPGYRTNLTWPSI